MREILINLTAAEIRAYQDGETVLRRKVKPQPPTLCGGLTVELRDIPESGLVYAAYEHDRSENCVEYRPIPQLSTERWKSPFGAPGDVLKLRQRGHHPRWFYPYHCTVLSSTVERRGDVWEWVAVVEGVKP